VRTLYHQAQMPVLQNRVYSTRREAIDCPKGDIRIVENQETGLIYNAAFDPRLVTYDQNYNNEQGHSPSFKEHLEQVAEVVERALSREKLIEVGCGKGLFLEMLLERGIDVTGMDPSYDGTNPRVIKKYFEPGIIDTPARGLILRHVLEHVPGPFEFLSQLRDTNGGGGLIYIEVPCLDWIIKKRAWFDIFYEHVNYFRLIDFDRMFGKVIHKGRCFGDQYLYVIADLESLRAPVFAPFNPVNFPADFLNGLTAKDHTRASVWGAASKGVIYSLLRERAGYPVKAIIDLNPAKQGKYLPGTGIKVMSPNDAMMLLPKGDTITVMNPNYLGEIKRISNHKFKYEEINS
jgi:SAM-dependent methyltransferase